MSPEPSLNLDLETLTNVLQTNSDSPHNDGPTSVFLKSSLVNSPDV